MVNSEAGFSVYLFSPPTRGPAPRAGSAGGPWGAGAPNELSRAELLGVHARFPRGLRAWLCQGISVSEEAESTEGGGAPAQEVCNLLLSEQEMGNVFIPLGPKSSQQLENPRREACLLRSRSHPRVWILLWKLFIFPLSEASSRREGSDWHKPRACLFKGWDRRESSLALQ